MIIITGAGRSRTSLTMSLLEAFGHSFVGSRFVNEETEKPNNANGIFEKNGDSIHGYKGENSNKAIKLILTALFPNKCNGMKGTAESILRNSISIMCLRKPFEIAKSVQKVHKDVPISPGYVLWEYCAFLSWLDYNRWFIDNLYTIDTDGYFTEPKETVLSLAGVVGCPKGISGIEDALALIEPKYTTTVTDYEWGEEFRPEGELVDRVYECFINNDFETAMKHASEYVNNWGK